MKCTHIRQAKEKMNNLVKNLNDDPSFWKKTESFAWGSDIQKLVDEFNRLLEKGDEDSQWMWGLYFFKEVMKLERFTFNSIKWGNDSPAYKSLMDIYDTLDNCNCYSNVSSIESDLSFYKDNYSDLQDSHSRTERELRSLRGEKEDEIRGLRERLENEKRERQNDKTRYNNKELEWEKEKGKKNAKIAEKEGEVKSLEKELENEKKKSVKLDDKLEARNREIRELNEQLEKLRANNENLRERAELSQEELLEEKLRSGKENLEIFATELKIDLEQVYSLRKYHERLFQARKSNNQTNITTHEDNIEKTKRGLLGKKVSIIIIQEVCRKCEMMAELSFGLEQFRKKQNLISDWKNINPNFTLELVQEWKNCGFTVEQCRDWINISPPSQQNLAVKEPSYYAWLRDIKKVNAEWVLNEGDSQQLGLEFLQWYQEQQQQYHNQQEQPTK